MGGARYRVRPIRAWKSRVGNLFFRVEKLVMTLRLGDLIKYILETETSDSARASVDDDIAARV